MVRQSGKSSSLWRSWGGEERVAEADLRLRSLKGERGLWFNQLFWGGYLDQIGPSKLFSASPQFGPRRYYRKCWKWSSLSFCSLADVVLWSVIEICERWSDQQWSSLSSRYVKDELHINTIRSTMKFSQEFQKRRGGTVESCKVTQIDHQVEIVSPNQNQILRLVHVDFQLPCFCLVFGISSVFVTRWDTWRGRLVKSWTLRSTSCLLKVGQNIDFHCTRIIHPRKILLGMPPPPDDVVTVQRFDRGRDAGGGFMGNIHIQGSGALLIPYGVTPHPPPLYRQGKHQSTHFRELRRQHYTVSHIAITCCTVQSHSTKRYTTYAI